MHSLTFLIAVVVGLSFGFAGQSLAQDPVKVAPEAYQLKFENEWAKVMRVHYAPHVKLPAHDHTDWAAAYVYLNDSGPVIFRHIGLSYGAITRAAVKQGSVRLYKAVKEVHEVENPADTPSDFLRIEFKTEPVNAQSLRGRFHREEYPAGEHYQKVQFENEQLRLTRLVCAAGKPCAFPTNEKEPSLFVALSPANFKLAGKKSKAARLKLEPGQTHWLTAGQPAQFENTGAAPVEMLRFDLKTKPVAAGANAPHAHPHN